MSCDSKTTAHYDLRLTDHDYLASQLGEAASRAAAVLLSLRTERDVRIKGDGSPVCSADLAADQEAKAALAELFPGIPVMSEESVEDFDPAPVFISLDPLDGTRDFLADGANYCVAIAMVENGRPIAGAIAAPELGRLWYGGRHAYTQRLHHETGSQSSALRIMARPLPDDGPVTLVSRFHGDETSDRIAAAMKSSRTLPMSSAVKFGLIASGEADLHIRMGPTMEWDIAAGDAILAAAGGAILDLDGKPLRYGVGERGYRNPSFVAASSHDLAERAVAVIGMPRS